MVRLGVWVGLLHGEIEATPHMVVYICKHCESRNYRQGRCISCDQSLGSLTVAIKTALVVTVLYGGVWIGLALLTGMILTPLAMGFGAAGSREKIVGRASGTPL